MSAIPNAARLARSGGALIGVIVGLYAVFMMHFAIFSAGTEFPFRHLLEPVMIVIFLAILGWVITRFVRQRSQPQSNRSQEPATHTAWFSKGAFWTAVLFAFIVCAAMGVRMAIDASAYFIQVFLLMGGVPFVLSLIFLPLGLLAARTIAQFSTRSRS